MPLSDCESQLETALRWGQEMATQAAQATASRNTFAATMSHEIRAPIHGIVGMTELLGNTDLTPEQHQYVQLIKTSADALLTLVNDILDFAKIETSKLCLNPIDFSLRDLLGDTLRTLAPEAHHKALAFLCHIPPELPDLLVGDAGRVRQIIVNLVGNAIKFTAHGEVKIAVRRLAAAETDVHQGSLVLHFTVRDTGIGIAPEQQTTIFQPFAQGDETIAHTYGGTGLGLAICKRLTELMGGRLWVESMVGQGSTFHFTATFGLAAIPASPATLPSPEQLHNVPILVVDDYPASASILAELLAAWHLQPTVVATVQTAIAALEQAHASGRPFPLLLLDTAVSGNGFAVAAQLKHSGQANDLRIIMLTAVGQRGDAARCQALGLTGYLSKPIKHSDLLAALRVAMGTVNSPTAPTPLLTRHSLRESQQRRHILLVEDNLINQTVATRLLEQRGYTVVLAKRGQEALEALACQYFDLVLMDVQMPGMDGLQVTRTIRAQERSTEAHLPIVAMTANAMPGDRERCLEAGMDAYMAKPVQAETLFTTIETVLAATPTESLPGSAAPSVEYTQEDSSTAPAARAVFNQSEGLRCFEGDEELYREVLLLFQEEAPQQMQSLHQAIHAGDLAMVQHYAHSLKSTAGNIGAQAMRQAALETECAGLGQELTRVRVAYDALQREFVRLQHALAALPWRASPDGQRHDA